MQSLSAIHIVGCHAEGEVGDVIVGGVAPPPTVPLLSPSGVNLARHKGQVRIGLTPPSTPV